MKLHSIVESILTSGKVSLPDGILIDANSHIPRDECELIYRQIKACGATEAIEVGMAFGISTLCLCDALAENAKVHNKTPRLIGMDPAQHDNAWRGVGLHNVNTAGFGAILEFHEKTSQDQLPQLVREGRRVQFAFIDGWHTFDHTLIDFFYVDQMLVPGGIIVLDDIGYPSINAAARFILSNRSYELVEALRDPKLPSAFGMRKAVKRFVGRFARTNHTPSAANLINFLKIQDSHAIAIQKVADDHRRWDHYAPF